MSAGIRPCRLKGVAWFGLVVAGVIFAGQMMRAAETTLIWSDEFNLAEGAAPDSAKWVFDLGGGGWGNKELETYTNSRENSFITRAADALDGHALAIRAVRTASGGFTSARLKTLGKFSVTYGRIEARMKLTRGRGVWPAFWMLGNDFPRVGWPACGEIDVMEQVGHEPGRTHGTLHGPGYAGSKGPSSFVELPEGKSLSDAFHVYAVDWAPDRIEWLLDGVVFFRRTPADLPAGAPWVFHSPAFLLLNLAIGGNWPGNPDASTTFPQTLLVDYVRVYSASAVAAANP